MFIFADQQPGWSDAFDLYQVTLMIIVAAA